MLRVCGGWANKGMADCRALLRFFCQIGEVGVRILFQDGWARLDPGRLKSYKWNAENIVKDIGVKAEEMVV